MTSPSLAGKIVLVTGASRGIGYQAALEAGRRGAHVIAVARTIGSSIAAGSSPISRNIPARWRAR